MNEPFGTSDYRHLTDFCPVFFSPSAAAGSSQAVADPIANSQPLQLSHPLHYLSQAPMSYAPDSRYLSGPFMAETQPHGLQRCVLGDPKAQGAHRHRREKGRKVLSCPPTQDGRVAPLTARCTDSKAITKPEVSDPALEKNIIAPLYKGLAMEKTIGIVGTGSTADAIRWEAQEAIPLFTYHFQAQNLQLVIGTADIQAAGI